MVNKTSGDRMDKEKIKKKVGAPRKTTPEKDELIELGKELVAWAEDTKHELRYHLNQWYTLKKGFTKVQYDKMVEKPEFREYHEKARVALAARYVDSSIHPSIAQRFLRLYFPDMAKDENDLLKFKSDLTRKENEAQAHTLAKLVKASKNGDLTQK
jgi:hypothetical protein